MKIYESFSKRRRIDDAKEMLDNIAKNPKFVKGIIIGDET